MTFLKHTPWGPALAGLLLAGAAHGQGIYTCVDAQGKRHTADRPIMECLDREQKELTPRGTVRRVVPPALTADERAALKERERADAERAAQADEAKRKERLLLQRYPNQAAHDRARAEALAQADAQVATLRQQQADTDRERERLAGELEFYRKDPAQAPARLKHRQQEIAQQSARQQQAMAAQETEKQRINTRFDEELARLRQLWSGQPATASR